LTKLHTGASTKTSPGITEVVDLVGRTT